MMKEQKTPWLALLCVALILAVSGRGSAQGLERWASIPDSWPATELPRLSDPLTLDGKITEWASAVAVPVRSSSGIAHRISSHEWRGPSDASMEVFCAWNDDGLCLAVDVADDDVINTATDGQGIYGQDSLELYVDGRAAPRFMQPYCSPGFYQIFVRPPSPARPVLALPNERDGVIDGLEVAAQQTATGYTVEVLIPWGAYPELSATVGAEIGILFGLNDYDARDGGAVQPFLMNYGGAKGMYASPHKLIKWTLADVVQRGPDVFAPEICVDVPQVVSRGRTVPVGVEIGSVLSPRIGSLRMQVTDAEGNTVFDSELEASPARVPWEGSLHAEAACPFVSLPDGLYVVIAHGYDGAGQPLGVAGRSFQFMVNATEAAAAQVDALTARLESLDVAALSQSEPFKGAAWLGAAVCVERLKRGIELGDVTMMTEAAREAKARLDLLESGTLEGELGLYDLLILTADPEAQVVVEYPSSDWAAVTFYWGAIPLTTAHVNRVATPEEAIEGLKQRVALLADQWEETTVAGMPARVWNRHYEYAPLSLDQFAPDRQVMLVNVADAFGVAIGVEHLSWAEVEAAAVLPDCPDAIRDAVERWAKAGNVPLISPEEATKKESCLLAGDVRTAPEAAVLKGLEVYQVTGLVEGATVLRVAVRDRLLLASGPSRSAAERVAGMVTAAKPISAAEVDTLRADLVKALAPEGEALAIPEGLSLFCGDLHMHTFYSDGTTSPVALALQSLHCYMDFAAITDHDTIRGAQLAQKLLGEHGFAHSVIVGEEISATWAHMNAYPLKEAISAQLPHYEIVKTAHVRGAVIQWNHPDPGSDFGRAHFETGLAGTGFDAWEHMPPKYDEWKEAGTLPVLVGATDTHSGTFSWPERTIILAPTPEGDDVAEAIRWGHALMVTDEGGKFVYGPDDKMIAMVWAALAEGTRLKAAKAEQLKAVLKEADLTGLLEASESRPLRLEELSVQ